MSRSVKDGWITIVPERKRERERDGRRYCQPPASVYRIFRAGSVVHEETGSLLGRRYYWRDNAKTGPGQRG